MQRNVQGAGNAKLSKMGTVIVPKVFLFLDKRWDKC